MARRQTLSEQIKVLEQRAARKQKRYNRLGIGVQAPLGQSIPSTVSARRARVKELSEFNRTRIPIVLRSGETLPLRTLEKIKSQTDARNRERGIARTRIDNVQITAPTVQARWLVTARSQPAGNGQIVSVSRPGGVNNAIMPVNITELPASRKAAEERLRVSAQPFSLYEVRSRDRRNLALMFGTMGRDDVAQKIMKLSNENLDVAIYRLGIFDSIRLHVDSPKSKARKPESIEAISGSDSLGEEESEWLDILLASQ